MAMQIGTKLVNHCFTKKTMYIRGQDEVSVDEGKGGGFRFTWKQALASFGDDFKSIDEEIEDKGSAILVCKYDIFQIHLNTLLDIVEMEYDELNRMFNFNSDLRNKHKKHSMWDWVKVCNYFYIDPISFGYYEELKIPKWLIK